MPARTKGTPITSKSHRYEGMERIWPGASEYYSQKRVWPDAGEYMGESTSSAESVKKLHLYTCEEHIYNAEERSRERSLLGCVNGVSILVSLFNLFRVGLLLLQGFAIAMWDYMILSGAFILMLATFRALGPKELQKAFKAIQHGEGASTLTIRLANPHFAEELIRSNEDSVTVLEEK